MKTLIFLVSCLVCSIAAITLDPKIVAEKFQLFQKSFERSYSSSLEESLRKRIFEKKLEQVEEHNARFRQGLESYEIEINNFSDRTEGEFQQYTTGDEPPTILPKALIEVANTSELDAKAGAPASLDWRSSGIVTPVKDQKQCGSCWAFAATGTVESHYRKKYGASTKISLSEQQLVDCVTNSYGCQGGWAGYAFSYIHANGGINQDSAYKYEAKNNQCRYSAAAPRVSIQGYGRLLKIDENLLRDTVASLGPIAVSIKAIGTFAGYRSGVYYNPNCGTGTNHAVVIVGYGRENNQDYWLVKNSWGDKWGLAGYIKMARNRENNCQIATRPVWPVL